MAGGCLGLPFGAWACRIAVWGCLGCWAAEKLGLLGAAWGCLKVPGGCLAACACLRCLGFSGLLWVAFGCLGLPELPGQPRAGAA